MSILSELLGALERNYSRYRHCSDFQRKVVAALSIKVEGTDVHRSLRSGNSNKDQIDLTYGDTLQAGHSPVDDFFPSIKRPDTFPQQRHLKIPCKIWSECLGIDNGEWVDDFLDVVRLPRNDGRNWSLQLRGVDQLRRRVSESNYLIFIQYDSDPSFRAFTLPANSWNNPSGKNKEVMFESSARSITYELEEVDVENSKLLNQELIRLCCQHCNVGASLKIQEKYLRRVLGGLASKNFLILTGLSGSGKTKLAQAFSTWICEEGKDIELVPVGADWTSRENVLGYVDTINQAYHKEAALELILRAKANCDDVEQQPRPFFLILDEMNLSHVERYFSDFLSAIESEKAIPMHSNEDADKPGSGIWCGVPQGLKLPKNLFVIGTVNVDETTYMFSPKVLDRANTIEFRVDPKDFDSFMDEAKPIELERLRKDGKGLGFRYGPALVGTAAKKVSLKGVDDAAHEQLKREMGVLIRLFGATGWEFGYRTGKEVTRFVYFHKLLTGSGWQFDEALDAQIVQKLMPKLNGSEDKLRGILCALAWYSSGLVKVPEKADDEDDGAHYQKLAEIFTQLAGKGNPENLAKALSEQSSPLSAANAGTEFEWDSKRAKLPLTFDKTLRMWRAAKQNGFTSYAEN